MRALLRSMEPDNFEDISAVLALYRPGPMGANAHNDYADRKNGRKPIVADPPRARRAARRDPRRHLRRDRLPGAGHGDRAEGRRLHARAGRPPAPGDGQEEEGGAGQGVRAVLRGHAGERLLRPGDQARCGTSSSRSPTTRSTRRTPPATAWCRTGRRTSRPTTRPSTWRRCSPACATTRTSRRCTCTSADAWASRCCRRTSTSPTPTTPRAARTSASASPRSATSARTSSPASSSPVAEPGQLRRLPRLPRQGRPVRVQQADRRVAGQGRRVRLARAHPPRGLVAVHAEAVDAVLDTKRNEAIGQFDLFGSSDDAETAEFDVELADPGRRVGQGDPARARAGHARASTSPTTRSSASSTCSRRPWTAR